MDGELNSVPPPDPLPSTEEVERKGGSRLFQPAHPLLILLCAAAPLASLYFLQRWADRAVAAARLSLLGANKSLEQLTAARDHALSLRDLKASDVERFKSGFSEQARSSKTLFEAGLSLQEERRLLEKQWEIMTTYLMVNPALQRVFLMHGDQPMQSYLISYFPLKTFGDLIPVNLPNTVRIVSKERFAHPERGRSEQVDGALQWNPPQVGTSVRSNALGEFVMFTNSKLILHGPPLNPDDHEKFPHVCLGLDREAARKLYRSSFIGTKIVLTSVTVSQ